MSIFKECADIQTADLLNLPVPEAEYVNEVLKPSSEQQEMVKAFAERAEAVRGGGVDPSEDNMLRITNDGRKCALDQRLLNDMLPDAEGSKVNQTIYFTDAYGSATAYQVMAVVKYSIDDLEEWDFRIRNHADMESYNAWMEQLQGRALYYAEPDHAPTSIITLATCDRRVFGKNGRFLVIAGKATG